MTRQYDEFFVQRFLAAIRGRITGEESPPHDVTTTPIPETPAIIPVFDVAPLFTDFEKQRAAPQAVLIPGTPADVLATGDLWTHAGQRTSGAGGAGQFSGVLDSYSPFNATAALNRISIVYLRFKPSVDAILRIVFTVRTAFGALADLTNPITGALTSTTSAHPHGFEDQTQQTATPETTPGVNESSIGLEIRYQPLPANAVFEIGRPDGQIILGTRNIPANQLGGVKWGVWAAAAVTAITVDYTAIVKVTPSP